MEPADPASGCTERVQADKIYLWVARENQGGQTDYIKMRVNRTRVANKTLLDDSVCLFKVGVHLHKQGVLNSTGRSVYITALALALRLYDNIRIWEKSC